MSRFIFKRPALARSLADILTGDAPFGAEPTLCLAAPRRTGKSTFLRHDLAPELENRNTEVIYVDLWADRAADPARLIAEAIKTSLRRVDGLPLRAARSIGLSKIGAAATQIDIDRIGQPQGPTISELVPGDQTVC